MIRERWFADAYEFTEGNVRDVEYRSGQLGAPAMRGSNATVAQRTGEVWRPKVHEAGSFTLSIWFGTYQRQAQAMWDDILRAVVQPHRLVTWRRITADGETRFCEGEVVNAFEPTAIAQSSYRADLDVRVPAGYWRGDQMFTYSSGATGPDARTRKLLLPGLSKSTATLEKLAITLTGGSEAALSNPVLADTTDRGRGDVLQYNGLIGADQSLALDNETWALTPAGGLALNSAAVQYTGDRFLALAATPPGVTHELTLTSTATIPAGAGVTVSGYRSYLC